MVWIIQYFFHLVYISIIVLVIDISLSILLDSVETIHFYDLLCLFIVYYHLIFPVFIKKKV